ncbi:MAG: nuclear transport factor 2 family protein [Bacteroidia bacterium]|nr:nuclear transport factor 2 family protein [Bacteroidia bacterium]NNK71526.1 nuclear transport factor 2 family protein [Flavobacteriaceae bacterium]NNL79247.1 nuclear transport factor 2 family protein [Flavobacteriaceae bacterium]
MLKINFPKIKCLAIVLIAGLCVQSCKDKPNNSVHGRKDIQDHKSEKDSLFHILKAKDSMMFELAYNQLNFSILDEIAADDIEFYHDQSGATYNKTDFINGMDGLTRLDYKARRELNAGTTEVFPLFNNGELYAAILMAEHSFYAKELNDKPEYLTSTAKYTTLWIIQEGEWKMSRIYSYDHQSPKQD